MMRLVVIAMLVMGCTASDKGPVSPTCESPAPLFGQLDPGTPGFIVLFHDGIEAEAETARLAGIYGFVPTHTFTVILGFSAELDDETVQALRCEPSVKSIQYDQSVGPAVSADLSTPLE